MTPTFDMLEPEFEFVAATTPDPSYTPLNPKGLPVEAPPDDDSDDDGMEDPDEAPEPPAAPESD